MAVSNKKKIKSTTVRKPLKTISIDVDAHELLKNFCDEHGYNIGTFCQIASLKRMREVSKEIEEEKSIEV